MESQLLLTQHDVDKIASRIAALLPTNDKEITLDNVLTFNRQQAFEFELRVGSNDKTHKIFRNGLSQNITEMQLTALISILNANCEAADGPFVARKLGWDVMTNCINHHYIVNGAYGKAKLRTNKRMHSSPWWINLPKIQLHCDESSCVAPIYEFLGISPEQVARALHDGSMTFDNIAKSKNQSLEKKTNGFVQLSSHNNTNLDLRLSVSQEVPCIIHFTPNRFLQTALKQLNDELEDNSTDTIKKRKRPAVQKRPISAIAIAADKLIKPITTPIAIVPVLSNSQETRLRIRKSWLLYESHDIAKHNIRVMRPSWIIDLTFAWHGKSDAECIQKACHFFKQQHGELYAEMFSSFIKCENINLNTIDWSTQTSCMPAIELEVECAEIEFYAQLDKLQSGLLTTTISKGVGIMNAVLFTLLPPSPPIKLNSPLYSVII